MKTLALLLALAAGCSATTGRPAATSRQPVGCCCAYSDCREQFTQDNCVSQAEVQGWTYSWHAGPCNKGDVYPAPDRR